MLVWYWFFSWIPVSVLKPRSLGFHGTGSGSSVLVPASWYQGFGTRFWGGIFAFVSFCYWFSSISVQFRHQIRWNLKLRYWNLNWLEPNLLKIFGTKKQKLRLFRYYRFLTNTNKKGCQYVDTAKTVSLQVLYVLVIWVHAMDLTCILKVILLPIKIDAKALPWSIISTTTKQGKLIGLSSGTVCWRRSFTTLLANLTKQSYPLIDFGRPALGVNVTPSNERGTTHKKTRVSCIC